MGITNTRSNSLYNYNSSQSRFSRTLDFDRLESPILFAMGTDYRIYMGWSGYVNPLDKKNQSTFALVHICSIVSLFHINVLGDLDKLRDVKMMVKILASLIIFAINFVFYFLLFFLLKEEYFYHILVVVIVFYVLSFTITKMKFIGYKIVSVIAFVLAVLFNAHLLGWIQLW